MSLLRYVCRPFILVPNCDYDVPGVAYTEGDYQLNRLMCQSTVKPCLQVVWLFTFVDYLYFLVQGLEWSCLTTPPKKTTPELWTIRYTMRYTSLIMNSVHASDKLLILISTRNININIYFNTAWFLLTRKL